jgi:hypothetical protein
MMTEVREKKIDLKVPVVIKDKNGIKEDKVYSSLTLHVLKAKHLKYLPAEIFDAADMTEGEVQKDKAFLIKMASKLIPLIAGLAEVDEDVINNLDVPDLLEVANELGPFLVGLSETGDNASGQ